MSSKGFSKQLPDKVVIKAKKGDRIALELVYQTYVDASYTLAFRMCQNQSLAQDITQESFIKVINNICTFEQKGSFAGWIRKIVVREALNRMKADRNVNWESDWDIDELQCDDLFTYDWLSACVDLENLLANLSVTARTVLLLHEVEGLTHKEIAEIYGKSESFSKTTLNRAYKHLKAAQDVKEHGYALKR